MATSSLASKFAKSKYLRGGGFIQDRFEEESKHITPTPVPALNLALSGDIDGGLRPGITTLAGQSKTFKTLFGLVICKAYLDQHPDAMMIFYDSEGGASQDYFESVGIDLSRVLYFPIMSIEDLKFDMIEKLEAVREEVDKNKEDVKFIWFIDSLGNLASNKEIDDAVDKKSVADMTRAKAMKSFFRVVTPYFKNYNMSLITIQHTYHEIGGVGAPRQIVAGGCLLAGTEIITENGLKKIEDVKVGESVVDKNGEMTEVVTTWTPDTLLEGEPLCYEIEFEDGSKVTCSENHRFLVNGEWVKAKDLNIGSFVDDI